MRTDSRSAQGFSMLEVAIIAGIFAVVLAGAFSTWQGTLSRRRLQNAVFLLESDLRLANQAATANAGEGPRVEVCFRSSGYDIYPIVYEDPMVRTTTVAGPRIKSASAGAEYGTGVQIAIPDSEAIITCTADAALGAVGFLATGAPQFGDANSHDIVISLNGRSLRLSIQAVTGLIEVRD